MTRANAEEAVRRRKEEKARQRRAAREAQLKKTQAQSLREARDSAAVEVGPTEPERERSEPPTRDIQPDQARSQQQSGLAEKVDVSSESTPPASSCNETDADPVRRMESCLQPVMTHPEVQLIAEVISNILAGSEEEAPEE